jgi:hypothetical protein
MHKKKAGNLPYTLCDSPCIGYRGQAHKGGGKMELNDKEIYLCIAGFISAAALFFWLSFDSSTVGLVWTMIRN